VLNYRCNLVIFLIFDVHASSCVQGNEFSQFGRCVAMDLMRFCQSFQIMAQGGGDVLSQLLTKWSVRFEEKCARDPYWWLKAGAE
jgi:hypothetical protein